MLVALLAISVGATVLYGMVAIYYDMPRQLGREFRSYGANMVIENISEAELDAALAKLPPLSIVGITPYKYSSVSMNSLPITLVQTDFSQVQQTNPYWQFTGRLPRAANEIVLGSDVAEYMLLNIVDIVDLPELGRSVGVVGIVKTGGVEDGFVYAMLGDNWTADIVELSIVAQSDELEKISTQLMQAAPNITPQLVKRVAQSETVVLDKLQALVYLVTIIVLALTMICVATTMMAIVMERKNEIGLKKALGAKNINVMMEFLGESALLGLAGGLLGSILGQVFAYAVAMSIFGRAIGTYPLLILATLLSSMLIAIIASLLPARIAIKIEPAIVLKGE
ncbi:ABC transporter permease [Deferribacterales bacterium]|nr:ABC transporter permease [Deferribacterales bacterium]GHU84954.1 ABC transporter permease [Deferribacterales bacterium]